MNHDIYKVIYISNKKNENTQIPEKIIVFYGKIDIENDSTLQLTKEELNELFISNMNNPKFKNIFSEQELENIKEYNIPVEFSFDKIYGDDTIETIKKKIIKTLNYSFSFDEIYLFSKHVLNVTPSQLYNKLTNNGTLTLTKDKLYQFLLNVSKQTSNNNCQLTLENIFDSFTQTDKTEYTYDDIVELFFTEKETITETTDSDSDEEMISTELESVNLFIDIPIGQKLIYKKNDYLFVVNPFNVDNYDTLLINDAKNLITTSNKGLLLNYNPIICNTIYLCLAEDVLKYIENENNINPDSNLTQEITMQIYFPYCAEKNIFSLSDVESNHQELIAESKKMIDNSQFINQVNNIDLFYDIYYERNKGDNDLKYIYKGISHVNLEIKPDNDFNIPLEVIFKMLHANKDFPLIKFNQSIGQDSIYRLYANKVSENGKKIPYLQSATINKINDEIKSHKRVSVYIEYNYDISLQNEKCPMKENTIPIICEFDNHGHIFIYLTLEDGLSDESIDLIIKDSVNPVINIVKIFLEQNGYTIHLFNSLYDSNVIIRELKYEAALELPKDFSIDLKGNMGCITSLFNIIDYKEKKRFVLRYKRVSNYNEMEGQDAYIIEQFLKSSYDTDVITGLMQNFHISKEQAEQKVENLFNSLQLKRDLNKNARLKINSHPGFKTSIIQLSSRQSKCGETFKVEVENIDNIYYLSHIEILIDSFIRLLEYKESRKNTNVSKQRMDTQCKVKPISLVGELGVKDFMIHDDISTLESNAIVVEAESLEFPEEINEEELITDLGLESILFGDEIESESESESEPEISDIEDLGDVEMEGGSSDSETTDIEDLGDVEIEQPESEKTDSIGSIMGIEDISLTEPEKLPTPTPSPPKLPTPPIPTIKKTKKTSLLKLPESIKIVEKKIEEPIPKSKKAVTFITPIPIPQESIVVPEPSTEYVEGKMIRDITGEKLSNPNPFFERLMKRDPTLYRKKGDGKMNEYSRSCPWNYRKQPVILTDKEKEEIDKNHPGSYDKAIKYGSNPAKKYWYICPRYWDLKNNVSLSEKEVEELKKKEGDIVIPYDAKEVPPGKYIFEFTEDKYHIDKKTGKYINHNPGFQGSEDGLCIPCCFNNNKFHKKQQTDARRDCGCEDDNGNDKKKNYTCEGLSSKETIPRIDVTKPTDITEKEQPIEETLEKEEREIETKKSKPITDFTIYGPERALQLPDGAWGYLPPALQLFFNHDNRKCYISSTNTGLKENQPCLFKRGVETSDTQSFIACIADLYNIMKEINENKISKKPSIDEMKKIILDAINLDTFMTYQNGNLIEMFTSKIQEEFKIMNGGNDGDDTESNTESDNETSASIPMIGEEENWLIEESNNPEDETLTSEKTISDITSIPTISPVPIQEQEIQPTEEIISSEKTISDITSIPTISHNPLEEIELLQNDDDTMFKETILKKYENTNIYKSITTFSINNPDYLFLKKLILSYENFIKFIQSNNTVINHIYLWDIITLPNPKLFPNGINLIILEIPKKDITNDVDIICPTNHYASSFFNDKKLTAILIKKGNYFEPIYQIIESNMKRYRTNLFTLKGNQTMDILKNTINNIKTIFDNYCKPMNSIPKEGTSNISSQFPKLYEFENNVDLNKLISILKQYKFNIQHQVLNFDGKVIGLFINKIDEKTNINYEGTIMCNPSGINQDILSIKYIDDPKLWRPYKDTISFLLYVHNITKLPCYPRFKIIDDGKIVGIITETNQFISVTIDSNNIIPNDNIPIMNDFDYNIADIEIYNRLKEDPLREKYVKHIYLENNFYNVFRNTVRILLNKYQNKTIERSIQELIKDKNIVYLNKLNEIQEKVKKLIENYISFDDDYYNDTILMQLSNITTSCLTEIDSCNKESKNKKKYCLKETDEQGNCKLIIPKTNLTNKSIDNEVMYIGRLADELIRYSRIRSYMFDKKIFLTFSNIGYNLRDDEIIILESMLTPEYFKNLIPIIENEYVDYNTFDTAYPLLTELYSNIYDSSIGKIKQRTCKIEEKEYSQDFNSILFNNVTYDCTFDIILYILKNESNNPGLEEYRDIQVIDIRNVLSKIYSTYINEYPSKKSQLINLLNYYGFETISNNLKNNSDLFDKFVYLDNYALTRLDIWILSIYYKLPIIIMSNSNQILPESNNKFSLLTTYSNNQQTTIHNIGEALEEAELENELENKNGYYIILAPTITKENISSYNYSLLQNKKVNNQTFILFNDLPDNMKQLINNEQSINKIITENEKPYYNFINSFSTIENKEINESKITSIKKIKPSLKTKLVIKEPEKILQKEKILEKKLNEQEKLFDIIEQKESSTIPEKELTEDEIYKKQLEIDKLAEELAEQLEAEEITEVPY